MTHESAFLKKRNEHAVHTSLEKAIHDFGL